jgi:hypothetical protein
MPNLELMCKASGDGSLLGGEGRRGTVLPEAQLAYNRSNFLRLRRKFEPD